MPRTRASTAALAALLSAALAGCGGGSSGPDCSDTATRANVKSLVGSWYLYSANVDVAPFDPAAPTRSPAEFLDAMVDSARLPGGAFTPDHGRGFSYLTTKSANQQFFQEGTSLGYGIGLTFPAADQVVVTQVFGDAMDPAEPQYALRSPAAKAGFARGDAIVAVAPAAGATPNAANLDAAANQVAALLALDPVNRSAFFAALGSGAAGTARDFRLRRAGGALVDVQATTALYWLDPVPRYTAPTVLTSPGGRKVGYLMLRSFITPANAALRTAFAAFKAQGVTDLVVDLRYDGGGLLDVASTFLDLMGQGLAGTFQFGLRHNAAQAPGQDLTANFGAEPNALAPARVAFIVREGSASASELLPFALAPHLGADVALVGERTLGKPAGQYGFSGPDCPTVYVLLSFQLANATGRAEYWDGLPDAAWAGSTCQAADDLTRPTGDPAEDSTRVALEWIDGGQAACTPIPPFQPAARQARALRIPLALPPEPSLAQRHIPNLQ